MKNNTYLFRLWDGSCDEEYLMTSTEDYETTEPIVAEAVEAWSNEEDPDFESEYIVDYCAERGITVRIFSLDSLDSINW